MSGVTRDNQDVDIDLVQLFRAIWERRKTVLAVTIVTAGVALSISSMLDKEYQSETRLLIEPRTLVADSVSGTNPPDELAVSSQVQLLQSTDLVKEVARDLKLFQLDEFDGNGGPLSSLLSLLGGGGDAALAPEERALKAFRKRLTVYQAEGSRVVAIQFTSRDPKLAAAVANKMAEVYLKLQSGAKLDTNSETARWLEPEIASLRDKVRDAEKKVADYRASSGLLQTGETSTLATQQLNDLTAELSRVRGERAAAEARAENVRNALAAGKDTQSLGDIVSSPVIQRLKEQESNIQAQISDLSTSLLEGHPRLKGLRGQLSGVREQIRTETRRVLASLESEANVSRLREQQLLSQLNTVKAESARAGENAVGLNALEREATAQRQLLETYLARYREAASRMDPNAAPADARVISRAVEPREPSFPKIIPITIVAALAGLILSSVFIMLSELFSGRALRPVEGEAPAEAEGPVVETDAKATMVPPPLAPADPVENAPAEASAEHEEVVADEEEKPVSDAAGVFTIAATAAALASADYAGRPVVVVSPDGDAGSALTVELARHMALTGMRVLVMDLTATGVPTVQMTGREDLAGITDLLTGQAAFGEIIHPDLGSLAHIVPQGDADVRTALRSIERLPIVLAALTEAYERVIVECGAVSADDLRKLMRGTKATLLFSMPDYDETRLLDLFNAFEGAGFDDILLLTDAAADRREGRKLQAA